MKQSFFLSAIGAGGGALVLAALFWWPLFRGGGFVGGDVYSYYLPQKVVYAEHLRHAELPLWNDRAGHGYPIVGESQTGAFYPPNAILYSLLGVNAAYNANHVLHYLLAFFFCLDVRPRDRFERLVVRADRPRLCLCLVPAALLLGVGHRGRRLDAGRVLVRRRVLADASRRALLGLTAVVALQLLAGHFNLAFLTLLALVPYIVLRVAFAEPSTLAVAGRARAVRIVLPLAALVCGFGLEPSSLDQPGN